jgi:hypothetical protein
MILQYLKHKVDYRDVDAIKSVQKKKLKQTKFHAYIYDRLTASKGTPTKPVNAR